jgi:hypothetical protein
MKILRNIEYYHSACNYALLGLWIESKLFKGWSIAICYNVVVNWVLLTIFWTHVY